MTVPVFEEYEPAPDCACPGCAEQRRDRARVLLARAGGHPAARGARRALVLATAAGVALGATGAGTAPAAGPVKEPASTDQAAEPEPGTPQGSRGPLHGQPTATEGGGTSTAPLRKLTRADIISRAKVWITAKVPYSLSAFWSDGYRQDCSGYISMAWHLADNEWTGSLATFGTKIARADLLPGDILLFHNPADPTKGSHVTLFGGWTDFTHTAYHAYEQTPPHTRKQPTPMAYWTNSSSYVPYRYKGLVEAAGAGDDPGGGETGDRPDFPGAASFGPGARTPSVHRLGQMLIERGGQHFYGNGPGPRWGEADRRATQAFQRAQGWRGAAADGFPGAATWRYLTSGLGEDIPAPGTARGTDPVPEFPGAGYFRPGRSGPYVELLGRQLVRKGFDRHYVSGPGPGHRWGEADRRNVEAFQRAQGRRGSAADGYPDAETWRRLFA